MRSLEPDHPCRYKVGDSVAILDVFKKPSDWGRVAACNWSSDGSDIGWWLRVVTPSGRHYICHSADLAPDTRSAVDRLADLA